MGLKETLNKVHQILQAAGVDHALIGALGLATQGVHRATNDVDLLVAGEQVNDVKNSMVKAGWRIAAETEEVLHFEGIGNVDFLLANRPLSLEMLSQAQPFPQHGFKCVSVEGLIGLKIQAYKNDSQRELQDKADIQALLSKHPELNWHKVKEYADLFGEWEFIEGLRTGK